jgi:tRNA threonylcarbamoyladenosine biosynthesis protein TsaE
VSSGSLEIVSGSPAETELTGERLGRLLAGGELVCLRGELGAGKTVLVRGLARALGCPTDEVSSPTYVLERIYCGTRLLLSHLDAYRLSGPDEFEESDLGAKMTDPGVVSALEWADRVEAALPPERLEVTISADDRGRRILRLTARGARYQALLEQLNDT